MSNFPIQHDRQEAWLASLPVRLGTRSIVPIAPGITGQIAAAWSDASSTSLLLEQLLVGDAAPSLSFDVANGLLRLYEYNARCRANEAPDTTWELPASRLQCMASNVAFQGHQE